MCLLEVIGVQYVNACYDCATWWITFPHRQSLVSNVLFCAQGGTAEFNLLLTEGRCFFSMQCSGSLFITLVAVTAVTSGVFSLWAAGQSVNAVLHMQRAVEANKDFFLIPWAYFERTKCKQNQKKINIFYESVYVSVAGRKCTIEGNHKHQMMVNGVEIWVCQTAQKLQGINTWVQLVCRAEHLPTWLHC